MKSKIKEIKENKLILSDGEYETSEKVNLFLKNFKEGDTIEAEIKDNKITFIKKAEFWATEMLVFSDLKDIHEVKKQYDLIQKGLIDKAFIFASQTIFNNRTNYYDLIIFVKRGDNKWNTKQEN